MVSRDTTVHVAAVLSGFGVLAGVEYFGIGPETGPAPVAVFLLFYGFVFGGAHLYLAIRGEDGMVPIEARWRYLAMLAVLLGGGVAFFYGGDRTLGSLEITTLGTAVIVGTLIVYFLTESVAGYRASRAEQRNR